MALAPLEKVEKLEASDEIIFNLATLADKEKAILEVGELFKEIGLLEDGASHKEIIAAYQESIQRRLQNYLQTQRKEKEEVVLNEAILSFYENLGDKDSEKTQLARTCRQNFIKYSCIVLSFSEQMNALRMSKKNDDYQTEAKIIDHQRTQVHNNCLDDIKIIDRLTKIDKLQAFVSKSITAPNRTDYAAAIIKLCYRKVIEEMDAL